MLLDEERYWTSVCRGHSPPFAGRVSAAKDDGRVYPGSIGARDLDGPGECAFWRCSHVYVDCGRLS